MAQIKPFKAVVYNPEKVKDLSRVVCPPYDIISPEQQQYYHDTDPHNFIHILFGKDAAGEDRYQRAQGYFQNWFKNGILVQDPAPAVYFYWQQFKVKGEKKVRFGFIALLRLEDKKSSIFAHEHTRLAPKEDRLKLLKAVKANLSPIFVVFSDRKRVIQRTYQRHVCNTKPEIDIVDREGVGHKVWKISDPVLLSFIESGMQDENIFIADGHHRYEVSCAYRDEMKQKQGALTGEESFNYTLAYFTNTDPRGLNIFPIHRLVKVSKDFDLELFKARLKEHFDLEEVKDKTRFFLLMAKVAGNEHVLGMYAQKKYWLLRLKNVKILDKLIADKPKEYRSLDVSILNALVLKNAMGLDLSDKGEIVYDPDAEDVVRQVNADAAQIGFILNSVKMEQIMAVALAGERMPPKSTYFYPKVLSGLVIHKH